MRVRAPVLVREATDADAGSVGEVHAEAWRVAYRNLFENEWLDNLVEHRRARWPDLMAGESLAGTTVLVAERGHQILGFIHFGPHRERAGDGELYSLYVHPVAWGSGLASTLLDSAWDALRDKGYRRVRLWTLAGANRARRFYARHGFQETFARRERDFGDGRPVLEVEYSKTVLTR